MNFAKKTTQSIIEFFSSTFSYFRDVLIMHGFILFLVLPCLGKLSRLILRQGNIPYLSYDTLFTIFTKHPFVAISLILVLLLTLVVVFFEYTFLLFSIFFIKKKTPIPLSSLLRGTLLQIKKIRFSTILFFLVYFCLLLPFSRFGFHSDILAKLKIPAFLLDFIFENRIPIIALVLFIYLILFYLSIRFIFALPEMIIKSIGFRQSIKNSWQLTKHNLVNIFLQLLFINGSIFIVFISSYTIILSTQALIETFLPNYAFISAILAMTLLQIILLFNIIFSTVSIFYVIITYMEEKNIIPDLPNWYVAKTKKNSRKKIILRTSIITLILALLTGYVGMYNTNYLKKTPLKDPLTISHRGVDNANGVQNTLQSLIETSQKKPDYIEMDIQETKDKQFVVMHDFHLKKLTGVNKRTNELTLAELKQITVRENNREEPICSFDEYLEKAKELNQKLLIEIKTTNQDSPDMLDRFIEKYRETILSEKHIIQTLTFDTANKLKEKEPQFYVGYILPFNIIGPPISNVDFFTMEYTTLNQYFIDAAHQDGKKVYAWTVNDKKTVTRMMFYGVDGIITDQLALLQQTISNDNKDVTYSDKLLHFVIGVG